MASSWPSVDPAEWSAGGVIPKNSWKANRWKRSLKGWISRQHPWNQIHSQRSPIFSLSTGNRSPKSNYTYHARKINLSQDRYKQLKAYGKPWKSQWFLAWEGPDENPGKFYPSFLPVIGCLLVFRTHPKLKIILSIFLLQAYFLPTRLFTPGVFFLPTRLFTPGVFFNGFIFALQPHVSREKPLHCGLCRQGALHNSFSRLRLVHLWTKRKRIDSIFGTERDHRQMD